jgi:PAS domain S-box-containing protein
MFGKLGINKKLALVLWGSALTAFTVAGLGLALFQDLTLEHRAMQAMEPYAQLVSVGTEAAVAFQDPVRAQEVLDTLRSNPEIRGAAIILDDGRVLAGFGIKPGAKPFVPSDKSYAISLSDDKAELRKALPHGAGLRLVMGLGGLKDDTRQIMWLLGAGGLVLLAVTFGQIAVLRRAIIRPVTDLAATAELVRTRADYDQTVPAVGNDEVAQLGRSFNAMMEAVRDRECDLRRLALFQRTILDNAAYAIISADPEGLLTSFNPAAERLLGYTADEVVAKQTPAIWHDPEEMAKRARELSEEMGEAIPPGFEVFVARARRGLLDENEWTFIRRDGSRVPALLSVTALSEESGVLSGFVGLVKDLSERKRAEEEIRKLNEELEQRVSDRTLELQETQGALMNIVEDLNEKTSELETANIKLIELDRLKSMFIASMSHELRTPLNSIIGFSSIIHDEWIGPVNTEQKENLAIIRQSGRHLLNLINDVIDVSKIEAGKIESLLEDFDLEELILEAVSMVRKEIDEKGLVLHVEVSGHPMHTDKRRLLQCILNLLSNAVKYTEKGSVLVETRVTQFIEGKGDESMVEITVTDTGIGINREGVKRLFQPFVRLGSPLLTVVPGTGLGLYLSRKLAVEVLKGDITVTSEYGRGSRFVIRVPSRLP